MGKKIKFRAWDKKNKKMKIVSELDFAYYKTKQKNWKPQGQLNDVWLEDENTSYMPIEVELMQYTGLKDRNGREIYERDIVTSRLILEGIVITGKVVFMDGSFFIEDDNVYHPPHTFDYDTLKIIGNIYENPELLER